MIGLGKKKLLIRIFQKPDYNFPFCICGLSFFNDTTRRTLPTPFLRPFIIKRYGIRETAKAYGIDEPQIKEHYLSQFEQLGVARQRVNIVGWKLPAEHLRMYGQIDIALDTYPYNGATTTCEALWMGVPTISLIGPCHASRVGLSILSRVGLEFFAVSTPRDYVARAAALAANHAALAQIRSSARARIATSGLCYAKGFAGQLETAYRQMWHRWCQDRTRAASTASRRRAAQKQDITV